MVTFAVSVAKGVLVQLFIIVAVTVADVLTETVYQSIVTEEVPWPAVTEPLLAAVTVQFTVVLGGSDDILKLLCPLLHTVPPPVMVGGGMANTESSPGGDGQLFCVTKACTTPVVRLLGQVTCIVLPALTTTAVFGNTFHEIFPVPVAV